MSNSTAVLLQELGSDNLAMESFIGKIFTHLGDHLRNYSQEIRNLTPIDKSLGDRRRLQAVLEQTDYASISPMLVQVPEGLKVDYLTYVEVVRDTMAHAVRVEAEALIPLEKILSGIISGPGARFNYNSVEHKKIQAFESERLELRRRLDACFDPAIKTKVYYGKAFRRNADWDQIFPLLEDAGRLTNMNTTAIEKRVKTISEMIDTVVKMNEEGDLPNMDQNLLRHIGELASNGGEEVSQLAVSYFHTQNCFSNLSAVIKALIKNLG